MQLSEEQQNQLDEMYGQLVQQQQRSKKRELLLQQAHHANAEEI